MALIWVEPEGDDKTGIETNFQLKHWKTRIQQIADEITAASMQITVNPRQDRMVESVLILNRVVEKLDFARAIPGDRDETAILMHLSVEEFRRKKAQQKCVEVG